MAADPIRIDTAGATLVLGDGVYRYEDVGRDEDMMLVKVGSYGVDIGLYGHGPDAPEYAVQVYANDYFFDEVARLTTDSREEAAAFAQDWIHRFVSGERP